MRYHPSDSLVKVRVIIFAICVVIFFLVGVSVATPTRNDLGVKYDQYKPTNPSPTSNFIVDPSEISSTEPVPTPTPDPDPFVDCQRPPAKTKSIRKSVCDKTFACQVGDNWLLYTSRDKCTKDQQANVPDYMKEFNAQLKEKQDEHDKACTSDKLLSNECHQATVQLNIYLRSLLGLMGGSTSELDSNDKLSEIRQELTKLEETIQQEADCNSKGGNWYWDGSWCKLR